MTDVMEVSENVRLLLTRDGAQLYEQIFSSTASSYTRHASDRIVLATSMASYQEASLGDINSTNLGEHLMVVSDQTISIAVNATTQNISADTLMMAGATISHLYFKNTDANVEATVEFVVVD